MKIGTFCFSAMALLLALNSGFAASPGGVDAGLQVWLRSDAGVTLLGGNFVERWADQSGAAQDAAYNFLNLYGELPPTYRSSHPGIGGQPSIRFDSVNALELDLSFLAGSDYTVIAVAGRDRFGLANFYIAGDSLLANRNLVLGYETISTLRQSHFNNDLDATVSPYLGQQQWSMDTFEFDQSAGRKIYVNGEQRAADTSTSALLSNTGTTLGHFRAFGSLFWFQGDLAEVVVYDRVLTTSERLRVEADIAGRLGLPLSVESYVSCAGPWKNHGEYVKNVAASVQVLREAGIVSGREGGQIVRNAAHSDCGR